MYRMTADTLEIGPRQSLYRLSIDCIIMHINNERSSLLYIFMQYGTPTPQQSIVKADSNLLSCVDAAIFSS